MSATNIYHFITFSKFYQQIFNNDELTLQLIIALSDEQASNGRT